MSGNLGSRKPSSRGGKPLGILINTSLSDLHTKGLYDAVLSASNLKFIAESPLPDWIKGCLSSIPGNMLGAAVIAGQAHGCFSIFAFHDHYFPICNARSTVNAERRHFHVGILLLLSPSGHSPLK